MGRRSPYSPELKARAARLVLEQQGEYPSQWAAILAISGKLGCSIEALRKWVRQAEQEAGLTPPDPAARLAPKTSDQERIEQLERELFEVRRANEILRKAAAFFAKAELDRLPH